MTRTFLWTRHRLRRRKTPSQSPSALLESGSVSHLPQVTPSPAVNSCGQSDSPGRLNGKTTWQAYCGGQILHGSQQLLLSVYSARSGEYIQYRGPDYLGGFHRHSPDLMLLSTLDHRRSPAMSRRRSQKTSIRRLESWRTKIRRGHLLRPKTKVAVRVLHLDRVKV